MTVQSAMSCPQLVERHDVQAIVVGVGALAEVQQHTSEKVCSQPVPEPLAFGWALAGRSWL
jgi:hypothetical protein